jgi:hypothetical protein
MKITKTLLICMSMPLMLWAQAFKVVETEGSVKYRAPKSFKAMAVNVNQELEAGGRIKIQNTGRIVLLTPKQDRIELSGDTYMRLEELTKTKAGNDIVKIELFKGVNLNKVHKLKKDEVFMVRTPTAVVGVRGTEFQCAVADNGVTEVNVLEGLVAVQDVDAQFGEVSVSVGKSAKISSDGSVTVSTVSNMEAKVESNSSAGSTPSGVTPEAPEAELDVPVIEVDEIIDSVTDTKDDQLDENTDVSEVDDDHHSSIPDETDINTTIETINR